MRSVWRSIRKEKAGGAIVEFALAGPMLLLLTMGAIDFGKAFYYSITVSNAANTGALVGSENMVQSSHYDAMQDAAQQDAKDIGAVTVTSSRVCRCPDGSTVDCLTGSCGTYGAPRVYVRCQVEKNFATTAPIPGVPSRFTIRREAYMRLQ